MTVDEELLELSKLSNLINLRIEALLRNNKSFDDKVIDFIMDIISQGENINKTLIISPSRKREIVVARMLSQYFIKKYTSLSLKNIGLIFGGRDHSTIIHAVSTINDGLDVKQKELINFESYDTRIRNYRDTIINTSEFVSKGTYGEIFSGEYINSLLDSGTRTNS
jgi:chromosomal replication initiation ATPase DnaA